MNNLFYIFILILLTTFKIELGLAYEKAKGKYGIDNPSSNSNTNLDRSKRLREGLFHPCEMGIIRNDVLKTIDVNSSSIDSLPIKGSDLFAYDVKRTDSILNNDDVSLYKPYEGVFVSYNITNFSKFVSRIVEMEIEMHLILGDNEKRSSIRKKEVNNHNFYDYQNVNFLIIAGYFGNQAYNTNKYLLSEFTPVFRDHVTLSRQNLNQYYARYGITAFKDRLTAIKEDSENDSKFLINNKINIDKHKLSFLYLPHNDTQLHFSNNGEKIVLPKLHLKAIQTHEEAKNEPEKSESEDEQNNSKKMVIVIFLLITMFVLFIILFYILVSWYLKGIENKNS